MTQCVIEQLISKLSPELGDKLQQAIKLAASPTPVLDTLRDYVKGQRKMIYAGVGSRETPPEMLKKMTAISKKLAAQGYVLQSGGAIGADMAFEGKGYPEVLIAGEKDVINNKGKLVLKAGESVRIGSKAYTDAYYVFSNANQNNGKITGDDWIKASPTPKAKSFNGFTIGNQLNSGNPVQVDNANKALAIVKELHPNSDSLLPFIKNLMARNAYQVFGANLDTPVDFVLFYAEESNNPMRPKGGTGQAVEAARRKGIPTINMADPKWEEQLEAITKNTNKADKPVNLDKTQTSVYAKLGDKTVRNITTDSAEKPLTFQELDNIFWSERTTSKLAKGEYISNKEITEAQYTKAKEKIRLGIENRVHLMQVHSYENGKNSVIQGKDRHQNWYWRMAPTNDLEENIVVINIYSKDKNGYEGLSNLAVRPFTMQGRTFQSVEHAYQSLKSGTGIEEDVYNRDWSKGGLVAKGTKGTKVVDEWNTKKLMPAIMLRSFEQNPSAAELLMSTGSATLTHNVGDKVWKDKFPELLMQIRNILQNKNSTTKTTVVNGVDSNDKQIDRQFIEELLKEYNEDISVVIGEPTYITVDNFGTQVKRNTTNRVLTRSGEFWRQLGIETEAKRKMLQTIVNSINTHKKLTPAQLKLYGEVTKHTAGQIIRYKEEAEMAAASNFGYEYNPEEDTTSAEENNIVQAVNDTQSDLYWRMLKGDDYIHNGMEDQRSDEEDVPRYSDGTEIVFQKDLNNKKRVFDTRLYNRMKTTLTKLYPEIKLIESTTRLSREMASMSTMFQLSNKLRTSFQAAIAKSRPDLVESGEDKTLIDDVEQYVDNTIEAGVLTEKDRAKLSNISFQWSLKGNIKIREDFEKVTQAFEIANKKGLDIFKYNSPNEIIEQYAHAIKESAINPDTVKEFTNKRDLGNGVVTYDVPTTKEGQLAARKALDTHFGEDSNPWCLLQRDKDGLTFNAENYWDHYKGQKRIAFQNGKLVAFHAGHKWWDRDDHDSYGIRVVIKVEGDSLGRSQRIQVIDDRVSDIIKGFTREGEPAYFDDEGNAYDEFSNFLHVRDSANTLVFPEYDEEYNNSDIKFVGSKYGNGTYKEWKNDVLVLEKVTKENAVKEEMRYDDAGAIIYEAKNDYLVDGLKTTKIVSNGKTVINTALGANRIIYIDNSSIKFDKASYKESGKNQVYNLELTVKYDGDVWPSNVYIEVDETAYNEVLKFASTGNDSVLLKNHISDIAKLITDRIKYDKEMTNMVQDFDSESIRYDESDYTNEGYTEDQAGPTVWDNVDYDDMPFQKIQDNILGMADLKAGKVFVDTMLQGQDTLPHEYAHHYISWFRDNRSVQLAIKKFGSEEALVQAIGEQAVKQKGEAYTWWQRFTQWLRNKFNKLPNKDKEMLVKELTEAFLTRKDLSNTGKKLTKTDNSQDNVGRIHLAERADIIEEYANECK